jgi:hypothetical protein
VALVQLHESTIESTLVALLEALAIPQLCARPVQLEMVQRKNAQQEFPEPLE